MARRVMTLSPVLRRLAGVCRRSPLGLAALLGPMILLGGVIGAPSAAAGRALDLFVVNFAGAEVADLTERLYRQFNDSDDIVWVSDANDLSLVVAVDPRDPTSASREDGRATLARRFRDGPAAQPLNLARALDWISDASRRFSGHVDHANIFLINTLFHEDERFRFAAGYPNDGFLFLDDSEFAAIRPVSGGGNALHVFAVATTDFSAQYQRFFHHLGKQFLGAELKTFSVAPNSATLVPADLPRVELAPIDRSLKHSQVITREIKPLCAHDDVVTRKELPNAMVGLTITNPCRRHAKVEFRLEQGGGTNSAAVDADGEGVARLKVHLRAGLNRVGVVGLDNQTRPVFETTTLPADDQIGQLAEDGTVQLTGSNPLRWDGDEVTIRHPASGRAWTVHVDHGEWKVSLPLNPGDNHFSVARPGNQGEPQPIDVRDWPDCDKHPETCEPTRPVPAPWVVCRTNNQRVPLSDLDLVLLIDATGSMGTVISRIKKKLIELITALRAIGPTVHIGAISYRDHGDSYVTMPFPLTVMEEPGFAALKTFINEITAAEGGDRPEALDVALEEGSHMAWRPAVPGAVVVVTDAPAHRGDQEKALAIAARMLHDDPHRHTSVIDAGSGGDAFLKRLAAQGGGQYVEYRGNIINNLFDGISGCRQP